MKYFYTGFLALPALVLLARFFTYDLADAIHSVFMLIFAFLVCTLVGLLFYCVSEEKK